MQEKLISMGKNLQSMKGENVLYSYFFVKFPGCQQRTKSFPAKNANTLEQNHIKMVMGLRLAYGFFVIEWKNDSFSLEFGYIIFRLIK